MNGLSWARQLTFPRKLAIAGPLGLLILAGLVWSFRGWWGSEPIPDYQGTGRIVSLLPPPSALHATRPVIIIHHDVVPGLMDEAMSMPFIAASAKLFEGVRPGDRIAFGLKLMPEALLVVSLHRAEQ